MSILYGLNDCLKDTLLLAPGWTFCSSFLAEICFIGDKVLWMFSRYSDLSLVFLSPLVSSFYCAWAAWPGAGPKWLIMRVILLLNYAGGCNMLWLCPCKLFAEDDRFVRPSLTILFEVSNFLSPSSFFSFSCEPSSGVAALP